MTNDPQVPWTDEQWARVNQVIHEEAARARVAASFLPLSGPLPPDTDFVREETIPDDRPLRIDDRKTIQLATLLVKVRVRTAQMSDPEMKSVLALFRRAANVLSRLEDAVIFNGLKERIQGVPHHEHDHFQPARGIKDLADIWELHGGQVTPGLWEPVPVINPDHYWQWVRVSAEGGALVQAVSDAIGRLEAHGHFGPFATVLGQQLFLIAQTPNKKSLVLPQDRIIPFLGGGPLLRSSTLDDLDGRIGVVVALGGSPVELVVARDLSLQFLQVTQEPSFLFRVREKIALRIKQTEAIVRLYVTPPEVMKLEPNYGPEAGGSLTHPARIIITGTNFLGATKVQFGESPARYTVESDQQITAQLPAHDPGVVWVSVTTPGGIYDKQTDHNKFTYKAERKGRGKGTGTGDEAE
jgi:uncharacterized linocin/CFP29 family protein